MVRYHGSETSKYVVKNLRTHGKGTRKFFRTRQEVDVWLRKTLTRLKMEGEGAIHMPEQMRIEAVSCAKRLRVHEKTLKEATNHFIAYLDSGERSRAVQALISEFKVSKLQDGASASYLRNIKHRLSSFEDSFRDRLLAGIQPNEIHDWMRSLKVAGQTQNNFRAALGTMYEFAIMRGYSASNPT